MKLKKVIDFNQNVLKLEPANCLTKERMDWFKNAVNEELTEFEFANAQCSKTDMLDALVDATYFILGRVYECGFTQEQWDKAFDLVHEANMQKTKGETQRSDIDAIKNKDWKAPEDEIAKLFASTLPIPQKNNISYVLVEASKLANKKGEDYNTNVSRSNYFPFGLLSYAQMLHVKTQRLNSLISSKKEPNNESIRDTLLDLINYACFTIEAIDKGEI